MTTIQQIAQAIITARDLCGDELAAAQIACLDMDIQLTQSLLREAMTLANSQWRKSQIAAGVPSKYHRF